MSAQPPVPPSAELLPPDDALIVAVRRGDIINCEQAARGDALYVLGTSPAGRSWVFLQRPTGTTVLEGVDDPRALYAALTIPDGPMDTLARLAFEALLHRKFREDTLRRFEAGVQVDHRASLLDAEEARARGRHAARQAHELFPAVVETTDNEARTGAITAEALHALVNGPTAGGRARIVPPWTERPLGHVRDDLLPRVRTENLMEALAADRAAGDATAQVDEVRRRAEAGLGPAVARLLAQRQALRAAATAEAQITAREHNAVPDVAVPRSGSQSPAHEGVGSKLLRLAHLRRQPLSPPIRDDEAGLSAGTKDGLVSDGAAPEGGAGSESAAACLDRIEADWRVLRHEALLADVGAAEAQAADLRAVARAESARAADRRQAADAVLDEQAQRAALPPADAASERLSRELISARRDRSRPAGTHGPQGGRSGQSPRRLPPPAPPGTQGTTPGTAP